MIHIPMPWPKRLLLFGSVLLALAALLVFDACTPGSGVTVQESDVIVTIFNKETNFGSFKTFAMPDEVFHLTDQDSINLSRDNDQLILDLVASNFKGRNYERVPVDTLAAPPDFVVFVYATAVQNWVLRSWGCYPAWGWGGWGWWGPWGPAWGCWPPTASYAFTTGTLLVDMVDPSNRDDLEQLIPVYWEAAQNGVLNDTEQNIRQRLADGINQMFAQSPYLISDK